MAHSPQEPKIIPVQSHSHVYNQRWMMGLIELRVRSLRSGLIACCASIAPRRRRCCRAPRLCSTTHPAISVARRLREAQRPHASPIARRASHRPARSEVPRRKPAPNELPATCAGVSLFVVMNAARSATSSSMLACVGSRSLRLCPRRS